ncbi:MAG: hypothetical protein ABR595_10525 [Psychroflexus sp.]
MHCSKFKGEFWNVHVKLGELKNQLKPLNGAKEVASYKRITTINDENIIVFEREKEGKTLIYVVNFSDKKQLFRLSIYDEYKDFIKNTTIEIRDKYHEFNSWEYKILVE